MYTIYSVLGCMTRSDLHEVRAQACPLEDTYNGDLNDAAPYTFVLLGERRLQVLC